MDFRFQSPVGPRVRIGGRERDYFSGTGYLGLQSHPAVLQAALDTLLEYGLSTATSRGGYGEHAAYDRLAEAVRTFFGAEDSLYYASGYLGTIILAQGLRDHYEQVFIDEACHFSVFDAARISGKPVTTFRHLDAADLAARCREKLQPGERPLVMSDGLFPISGELAPVPDYLPVVEEFDGLIALDDAHAAGAIGAHGRGTLDFWSVNNSRCYSACTLSKALGGYGGLIADTSERIAELDRNSRVYVAASPTPLPVTAAAAKALTLAHQEPERRARLWQNVARARTGLRSLGWDLPDLPVPIICLRVRPGLDFAKIKDALFEQDICIAHVKNYSSTPAGGALRIAIFATHTEEQIDRLVAALRKLVE